MKATYIKPIVITASVVMLNIAFGFDVKFTIINLIWLIPFPSSYEKDTRTLHR